MAKQRPIYICLMVAASRGNGIHLSADEVFELSQDDAIVTRAAAECEDDDEFVYLDGFSWVKALRSWCRLKRALSAIDKPENPDVSHIPNRTEEAS